MNKNFLRGLISSNTVQVNAAFFAAWTAFYGSDLVQANPELLAVFGVIQAIANVLLRIKTKVPVSERANKPE